VALEIGKLPQKYSDLWDVFKTVKHSYDEEAYEILLGDDSVREEFYHRLTDYSKTLAIAFSSDKFLLETSDEIIIRYKNDLHKFQALKNAVKIRYAEAIDYRDYEPKIRKLLDTQILAHEVIQLNEPVNIFDEKTFKQVKEDHGVYDSKRTTASKADTIAHATRKVVTDKMDEDPAFYERFSKLIQQAIDDFRAKRLSDLDYLDKVLEIRNKVVGKVHDDVPDKLGNNEDAMAYFGVLKPFFESHELTVVELDEIVADTAIAFKVILDSYRKVSFWDDEDARNKAINDIDDYLYDEVKHVRGVKLSPEEMDRIIEKTMQVARHRSF
ncbi:MAG: restriction endonuclease subunit R, partial [Candidatus Sabulitectum sp.]|nr:restriction endonuclease subunit R [Candidatus Sabulitectum sp.]